MLPLLPFLIAVAAQTVTVTEIRYIPPEGPPQHHDGGSGGQGDVTITRTFVITGALPTFEPATQAPQEQPQAPAPAPPPAPTPAPEEQPQSPKPEFNPKAPPADTQPAPADAASTLPAAANPTPQPAPEPRAQPDPNAAPPNSDITVITVTRPFDQNALSSFLHQPTNLAAGPAGPDTNAPAAPATTNPGDLGPAGQNPSTPAPAPATTNAKDLGPAGPNPTAEAPAPATTNPKDLGPAGQKPTTPAPAPATTNPKDLGPAGPDPTTATPPETSALQAPASGAGVVRPAVAILLVYAAAAFAL